MMGFVFIEKREIIVILECLIFIHLFFFVSSVI